MRDGNLDFFEVSNPDPKPWLFKKGNNISLNIGCPPKWNTPESFLESVLEYFQWCENNPITVDGVYGKDAVNATYERPKITTLGGFCVYCGSVPNTFYLYEKKPGFEEACSFARNLFSSNNIELASAGVANNNIIIRLEGLIDKKEVKSEQIQTVFFHVPKLELPIQNSQDLIEGEDWSEL